MLAGIRVHRLSRRTIAIACLLAMAMVTGCEPEAAPSPGNSSWTAPTATPPVPLPTGGTLPALEVPHTGPVPHLQWITGMGVNANVHNWRGGELKPAIDKIAELGQLTWRVVIDRADWEPSRVGSAGVFDWSYYEKIYSTGKMADLFDTIAYINTLPGQQVSVSIMGGVPKWMGETRIDPAQEDYWVRMIASMVYYGKVVRKLDFTLISPINEPDVDGVEGPLANPAQYVRLMEKLSLQLDKLGLNDIRFIGPDTGSTDKAVHDYWPAIAASETVAARFEHFGIHTYDGVMAGAAEALAASSSTAADVWVTEFSGPCPGCDTGAPNPGNWDTAQVTAELAIRLLRDGSSGLQFYDAWDGFYEHHKSIGYWGLLSYDAATHTYSPRKNYYVFRQLTEFTPASSAAIDCTSSIEAVHVACILDPSTAKLAIYGSNSGDEAAVKITVSQVVASADLAFYRTDAQSDMVREANVRMSAGTVSLRVGAHSVFTLATLPGS